MSNITGIIYISPREIIQHLKLACKLPTLLEEIANRKIITQFATQAGITVEVEELQQAADQFRLINKLQNSEETWSWLQRHHLSLDEFEELIYTNLLSSKLAQHLFGDKVEPFFFDHQLNYVGAAIYEVILSEPDLALEVFYALQEGEISFQEVARQYIQDDKLRLAGGYQGIVYRSQLKPEISAAVFAVKPPELLKPILTAKGVHLILVEEIIQPVLDEQLRLQILSNLFSDWLKKQIEQVEILTNFEFPMIESHADVSVESTSK